MRSELAARGHRFATASDTEVIVHAWEEYGDAVHRPPPRHVRGRAVGLESERFFSRGDRVGKKPLYYMHDGDRILFASELKALLRSLRQASHQHEPSTTT